MAKDKANRKLLRGWERLLPAAMFLSSGAGACGLQIAANGVVSAYGMIEALALGASVVAVNFYAIGASRNASIPSREAEARLALLARSAGQLLADSQVQAGLETNMNSLRSKLDSFGPARRDGGQLYYGDRLVNGEEAIVAEVARAHGGEAAVFLGRKRIATTQQPPGGGRADAYELEDGPIADAVFQQGRVFVGEAHVFGKRRLAVFEPIKLDAEVIGALYVGVERESDDGSLKAIAHFDNRSDRMMSSIEALHGSLSARAEVESAALADRSAFAEAARRAEAERTRASQILSSAMTKLSASLKLFAEGDLTVRLGQDFPDDFGKLRDDFNDAAENLMSLVRSVVASADSIHVNTTSISQSADDIARRTEQQAANIEETAAVLATLTQTLKKTAEGSAQAAEFAKLTDNEAKQGGVVVQRAVATMHEIADSSKQIGNIIGVIDEIAFQTNLLALNAGVEAARAGESGRGFAVVASEVRVLAQRCATSAKDIAHLINRSTQQVDAGVKMATDAGKALDRIMSQTSKIHHAVVEISATVKEQAEGLQEVNVTMGEMDTSTQQNAEMVEKSSNSTGSLSAETAKLAELMAQFRTESDDEAQAEQRAA